jgi:hypothetical protein
MQFRQVSAALDLRYDPAEMNLYRILAVGIDAETLHHLKVAGERFIASMLRQGIMPRHDKVDANFIDSCEFNPISCSLGVWRRDALAWGKSRNPRLAEEFHDVLEYSHEIYREKAAHRSRL